MAKEDKKYDIFISYRRAGGDLSAKIIRDYLKERGYRVFFDVDSLKSGNFNNKLYDVIDNCTDFVIVLSQGALDRCSDENDWVRKELAHAFEKGKNIIPIMLTGFTMPSEGSPEALALPEDIRDIIFMNGIAADSQDFNTKMKRLEGEFLKSKPFLVPAAHSFMVKKFLPVFAAIVLVAVIAAGIWAVTRKSGEFPRTAEEKSITNEVIYCVSINLTNFDTMAEAYGKALSQASLYLNNSSIEYEDVVRVFDVSKSTIQRMNMEGGAASSDLIERVSKLEDMPFSTTELIAMNALVVSTQEEWLDNLDDLIGFILNPDTYMSVNDRVTLVENYTAIFNEEIAQFGYGANGILVNVAAEGVLDDFWYVTLPTLVKIPLSASNWSTDLAALDSAQEACVQRIDRAIYNIATLVGDGERETAKLQATVEELEQKLVTAQGGDIHSLRDDIKKLLIENLTELGYTEENAQWLAEVMVQVNIDFCPVAGDSIDTIWFKLSTMVAFPEFAEYSYVLRGVDVLENAVSETDPNAQYYLPAYKLFMEQFKTGINYGLIVVDQPAGENDTLLVGDIVIGFNGAPCVSFEDYAAKKAAVSDKYIITVLRVNQQGKLAEVELEMDLSMNPVQFQPLCWYQTEEE